MFSVASSNHEMAGEFPRAASFPTLNKTRPQRERAVRPQLPLPAARRNEKRRRLASRGSLMLCPQFCFDHRDQRLATQIQRRAFMKLLRLDLED